MRTALILDVDGTLLDTNGLHVEGWRIAFERLGYHVSPGKIAAHIGEGGDTYVPDVVGRRADHRHGDALRKIHTDETLRLARAQKVRILPGARELLETLRARNIRTVLATSSTRDEFMVPQQSAGIDLPSLVDDVVTGDMADRSKPHPDLIHAALERLDLPPSRVAMVGDTIYDVLAAASAHVPTVALLSGSTSTEPRLRAAGAKLIYRDPADLLAHLEAALAL